ncbi:transposase [Clostridium sp.]|uniref:transposase n=1 Tax=Clostridium sp. TaxID=1506 RepID=UPI0035A097CD
MIHQLRSSMKYIPYKNKKAFAKDLKAVYGAVNEDAALENLMDAKEKWESKYPNAIKSWEDNRDNLVTFFMFPDYIRKIMYTTNAIESLNSRFGKITETKLIFPGGNSLMKMLYLATQRISRKWTRSYENWDMVVNQLNILFSEILNKGA